MEHHTWHIVVCSKNTCLINYVKYRATKTWLGIFRNLKMFPAYGPINLLQGMYSKKEIKSMQIDVYTRVFVQSLYNEVSLEILNAKYLTCSNNSGAFITS